MTNNVSRIKVWDSFIRLYHWTMVGLIGALWWSGENGEMSLHQDFAIVLAALIIVRVGWGFFGSSNARFSAFMRSPKLAAQHLSSLFRRSYHQGNTHSAAGGWAVVILLTLVSLQIITGLFSSDGILFSGPLNDYVSGDLGDFLTEWHEVQFNVIVAAVAVHVLAIIVYRIMGVPLLGAMISGYRNAEAQQPDLKPGWHGVMLAIAVWFILFLLLS